VALHCLSLGISGDSCDEQGLSYLPEKTSGRTVTKASQFVMGPGSHLAQASRKKTTEEDAWVSCPWPDELVHVIDTPSSCKGYRRTHFQSKSVGLLCRAGHRGAQRSGENWITAEQRRTWSWNLVTGRRAALNLSFFN
jgi:hypothetical protein